LINRPPRGSVPQNIAGDLRQLNGHPGASCTGHRRPRMHANLPHIRRWHIAQQDSTPIVMLDVGPDQRADTTDPRPFRRSHTAAMFGPIATWSDQIDDASRVPEIYGPGAFPPFATSGAGRGSGRYSQLRRHCLTESSEVRRQRPITTTTSSHFDSKCSTRCTERDRAGQRPLMLLGGYRLDRGRAADDHPTLQREQQHPRSHVLTGQAGTSVHKPSPCRLPAIFLAPSPPPTLCCRQKRRDLN